MSMTKTVRVVQSDELADFEQQVQLALNDGFEIKFSNGFGNGGSTCYYALLIKEESKVGGMTYSNKR